MVWYRKLTEKEIGLLRKSYYPSRHFSQEWWLEGIRQIWRICVGLFFITLFVGFIIIVTSPAIIFCAFDPYLGGAKNYAECTNPDMIRAREAREKRR